MKFCSIVIVSVLLCAVVCSQFYRLKCQNWNKIFLYFTGCALFARCTIWSTVFHTIVERSGFPCKIEVYWWRFWQIDRWIQRIRNVSFRIQDWSQCNQLEIGWMWENRKSRKVSLNTIKIHSFKSNRTCWNILVINLSFLDVLLMLWRHSLHSWKILGLNWSKWVLSHKPFNFYEISNTNFTHKICVSFLGK